MFVDKDAISYLHPFLEQIFISIQELDDLNTLMNTLARSINRLIEESIPG